MDSSPSMKTLQEQGYMVVELTPMMVALSKH